MDRRCLCVAVLVITSLGRIVSGESGVVNHRGDLDILTFPLTLDWYPFHNGFRVSGGLLFNRTDVDLATRASASLRIGDPAYSAAELGNVQGDARFDRVAPYAGVGWSKTFGKEGRWGIRGDLGVAFSGRSNIGRAATGPIASDFTFAADSAHEEKDTDEGLSLLGFRPIFSISLFYRF